MRIAKAGATPQGNRNAPQVEVAANEQVPANSQTMNDGEVMEDLL